MRPLFFALFSTLLLLSALNSGCRKDPLDEDPDARLLFSKDTVVFDTVFTTIGSATRQFKVYNTSSKAVNISSIRLAGGSASPFRINVDGVPLVSTGNILLRGGDSIFVFVDVTVNPNNSNSPLMISDSILFETNGNLQRVILNAVGQDAYFHYNSYLTCNEIWTNDKPHVIYGYAVIPQCCKLTIQAGARVHLHKNAVLAADSCATLEVLGAQNNPVVFQGDRLEPDYAEEPGQWGYIWLSSLSKDNIIDWAVIKNGTVGILSDSLGASANPTVRITNTKIRNMTLAGIYGRDTHIEGNNITVENCAQYCAILAYGGKYSFIHCTFGNYWSIDNRSTPAVVLNNWYKVTETLINRRNLEQADFINCIIYGDKDNELALDSNVTTGILFNYKFENCLIRTDLNTSAQPARFLSNVYNQNPQFINPSGYDLHILATSPAHNLGNTSFSAIVPLDLDGVLRLSDGQSDAGAYEAN